MCISLYIYIYIYDAPCDLRGRAQGGRPPLSLGRLRLRRALRGDGAERPWGELRAGLLGQRRTGGAGAGGDAQAERGVSRRSSGTLGVRFRRDEFWDDVGISCVDRWIII